MPYFIKEFRNGFKVCKKTDEKVCFSKKPLTKKMAEKQMTAINISEHTKKLEGNGLTLFSLYTIAYPIYNPKKKSVFNFRRNPDFPSNEIILKIAQNSYPKENGREKNIQGWELIKESNDLAYYRKDNIVIVGISGTKSMKELEFWFPISKGQFKTERIEENFKEVQNFKLENPDVILLGTSHSLGGVVIDELLDKKIIEQAISFNPASLKKYLLNDNHLRFYKSTDIVYNIMGHFANNIIVYEVPKNIWERLAEINPLVEASYIYRDHSIDGFTSQEISLIGGSCNCNCEFCQECNDNNSDYESNSSDSDDDFEGGLKYGGGKLSIVTPLYGEVLIGIPNMYYKNKLVNSLTKLNGLSTRSGQKSIILEKNDDDAIIIEESGQNEKDGVKFGTIKLKVPEKLLKVKKLKNKIKLVEEPVQTKTGNLTSRNKIRSIRFKTTDGKIISLIEPKDKRWVFDNRIPINGKKIGPIIDNSTKYGKEVDINTKKALLEALKKEGYLDESLKKIIDDYDKKQEEEKRKNELAFEEAKKKADEEAKKLADELKKYEEEKKKAEEAKKKAEEAKKKEEEEKKKAEEAKKKAEEAKKKADEEAKKLADELKKYEEEKKKIKVVEIFKYDKEFFDKVDRILSGESMGKKFYENKENVDFVNKLIDLQENFDFYQTPEECLEPIFKDIEDFKYIDNFIEPSFGFGKFTRMLIDRKNRGKFPNLKIIDGLEYVPQTYNFIKDKISITDLYNENFLKFNPTKDYDFIFINPPYGGKLPIKNKKGETEYLTEKNFWAYFVVKSIIMKSRFEKILYVLIPLVAPPKVKEKQILDTDYLFGNIPESTKQRILNEFNLKDWEEDIEQNIMQLSYIAPCNSFKKFSKGKVSNLGLSTAIYKIIVSPTDSSEIKEEEKIEEEEIPEPIEPPKLIKNPQTQFEEEVNKMIKFSLGHVNFDAFSRELINPELTSFKYVGGITDIQSQLNIYYLALKYKMSLLYVGTNTGFWDEFQHQIYIKLHWDEYLKYTLLKGYRNNMFNDIGFYKGDLEQNKRFFTDLENPPKTIEEWKNVEKPIIYTKEILKNNIKTILEKSKKQFVTFISFLIKSVGGHAVTALFRYNEKKIYVIDPHGKQSVKQFNSIYKEQDKYFTDLAKSIGYEYINSETSCPYIYKGIKLGFQAMENIFQQKAGFCGYWSTFILELALQNPDEPMVDIYKRASELFTDEPQKVFKTIIKYQANLSMIINGIAESEGFDLERKNVFSLKHNINNIFFTEESLDKSNNEIIALFERKITDNLTMIYLNQKKLLGYAEENDKYDFFNEDLRFGKSKPEYKFFNEDLRFGGADRGFLVGDTDDEEEPEYDPELDLLNFNLMNLGEDRDPEDLRKGGAIPINKELWEESKKEIKNRYKKWSAYASGALVKLYKEKGGKFKNDGQKLLKRWFEEDWKDVNPEKTDESYPVYRPTKKLKGTPLTVDEIDPENLLEQSRLKQKIKGTENLPKFKGGDNVPKNLDKTDINLNEIDKVELTPMDDLDIKYYLPTCPIYTYSQFGNIKDLSELLPREKSMIIFLYMDSPRTGHWCALSRLNKKVYFFDSYGGTPDSQLRWVDKDTRQELGTAEPFLKRLLQDSEFEINFNKINYQKEEPNISTCGAHCVLWLTKNQDFDMDFNKYYDFMKNEKEKTGLDYDEIVSALVSKR